MNRSMKKWTMLGGFVLALAACTRAPGGGATEPIETSAPTQSPVVESPASPEAVVSAPAPTLLDPGQFWDRIGGGENAPSYDSLGSLIRDADLVVVGVVTEFRDGRRIVFPETGETMYTAEVRVRVSDTLRGTLISPDDVPGTVVVETSIGFGPNPHAMAELGASTPVGNRVVLFLVNTNAAADRNGSPPDAPYRGEIYYLLPNGTQAAIWDEAGTANVGPGSEATPWLAKFKGQPFDRVVRDIQAAASTVP
jgi:hypothetical protein